MSIGVGDVLKVVAVLQWLDGDIMQNVFSAVIGGTGGPYTESDVVDDALAWVTAMFTNMGTTMSDEVDGSEVRVYVYDSVDDDYDEIGSISWTFNPTGATDQLPRAVSALINAKTTDPDVNGKKYIGGMIEDGITGGLLGAGAATAAANLADDWVGTFTGSVSGASWIPGIWSPTRTNFYAMSGSYIIPTIMAYQRRRKRGVGI